MSADPKFLWDIGYLENLKAELGDERKLLCLSPLSFRLLANMSNMLLWPTRFGLSRGDPIPDFIQDCYGELNNPRDLVGCLGAESLEDLIVNSEDIMIQITNNVDCCCGTQAVPTTIYCVSQDGTITYTPQSPQNPVPTAPDGLTFPFNPLADTVPGDFADWTTYDAGFCAFSNGLWQIARAVVATTETVVDIAAAAAALAVVLTPLLPAGVIAAIGGVTFLEVVWELVKIITSEQASDILNEVVAWLDDKKQEIICTIYSHRYDWGSLGVGLAQSASDYIELTLTLTADERTAVQNLIAKMFFWQVAAGYVAGELGVFTSDAPVDCSTCVLLGADEYDYTELHTTSVGYWTSELAWRADNGGELYSIGHVIDKHHQMRRTSMLTYWGQAHLDVESWFVSFVSFTIARNVAQAPDTEFYVRFKYRDGTYADVARTGTTDGTYRVFTFSNPYPLKEMWDTQAAFGPGVDLVLPADPGSSTWYEYFLTTSRIRGYYKIGTYTDYGDLS